MNRHILLLLLFGSILHGNITAQSDLREQGPVAITSYIELLAGPDADLRYHYGIERLPTDAELADRDCMLIGWDGLVVVAFGMARDASIDMLKKHLAGKGSGSMSVFSAVDKKMISRVLGTKVRLKDIPEVPGEFAQGPAFIILRYSEYLSDPDRWNNTRLLNTSGATVCVRYPVFLTGPKGSPLIRLIKDRSGSKVSNAALTAVHLAYSPVSAAARSSDGQLVVITPLEEDWDGGAPIHYHSSYEILDTQGQRLSWVSNSEDQDPPVCSLPQGTYLIRFRDNNGRSKVTQVSVQAETRTTLNVMSESNGTSVFQIRKTPESRFLTGH